VRVLAALEKVTLGLFGGTCPCGKFGFGGGRFFEPFFGGCIDKAAFADVSTLVLVDAFQRSAASGGRVGCLSTLDAIACESLAVSLNAGGTPGGLAARQRSNRGSGGRWTPVGRCQAAAGRSPSGTGCQGLVGVLPRPACRLTTFAYPS
jgi:hypothetical protein